MGSPDSITILCVDDQPEVLDLAASLLEQQDDRFIVDTVSSAAAALERLDQAKVDCIVSDYQMPGLNGIEFLEAVREEYPRLPFILHTGRGSEEVASEAISAGATDYLKKRPGSEQYELLANRIQNAVEQSRARQTIAAERDRRSALFDNTPDPIVEIRFESRAPIIEDVNPAFEEVFGFDRESVIGESVTDRLVPESGLEEHLALRDDVFEGTPVETEVRRQTIDGVREFELRIIPVDVSDIASGAYGWFTDITERKQRERNLELMNQLVEEMNDGAVIVQAGEIRYTNPRVSDLVDCPEDEIIGSSMGEFIAPEYREVVRDRHLARMEGDAEDVPGIYEIELLTSDGDRVPVEINVARIDYGDEPATLSLVREITEGREQELARQNERLNEFASIVSHDLRNPLQVAQGRVELAEQECDSDHLTDVAQAHERMESLIDNLLTLARQGERVDQVEAVELASTVTECWANVTTPEATLVEDAEQAVEADPTRLKQLLENLFSNAVEHGGDDVTVTVGTLETSDGFYIADDGPGIPPSDRDEVFDAGYSTGEEGTGLGLNIAKEIAEAHGWHIDITASEDGGARFDVAGVELTGG
jgi:PAS domain S-box-containing protein